MSKLKDAIESIAFAAILAGLDQAGTINIAEVLGITGDEGALLTGVGALVLAYAQKWAKAEEEKAEAGA